MKTIVVILFLIFISSLGYTFIKTTNKSHISNTTKEKIRVCPDTWIENRMPGPPDGLKNTSRQYFIIDGERRELEEFDLKWIKENCDIKPSIVY